MDPIVINLIGGPGVGKSTIAAGVFAELKWADVNCELTTEYAKSKVWEDSLRVLEDQVYILGKQYHRLHILKDKVDVVITDSPLFLSLIYGSHMSPSFANLALELFDGYRNLTYLIERVKPYNPKGRVQNEEKAQSLDSEVRKLLDHHGIPYTIVPGTRKTVDLIVADTMRSLQKRSER